MLEWPICNRRQETPFATVQYFVRRFHFMEDDFDTLELEYASFQSDPAVDKINAECDQFA